MASTTWSWSGATSSIWASRRSFPGSASWPTRWGSSELLLDEPHQVRHPLGPRVRLRERDARFRASAVARNRVVTLSHERLLVVGDAHGIEETGERRQTRDDHGLAGGHVFEELDRKNRLRVLVQAIRDDRHVAPFEVRGQLRIVACPEHVHVG